MSHEVFTIGSSRRFTLAAAKDGAPWGLTGAAVTLTLTDPGGNATAYTATVTDGPAGAAEYTIAATVLDEVGVWTFAWKVVVGGVTALFERESFVVVRSP